MPGYRVSAPTVPLRRGFFYVAGALEILSCDASDAVISALS